MQRVKSDLLQGLVSAGLIAEQEMKASLQVAQRRDHYAEELLITMGYISEANLLKFQAKFYKTQFISTQKLSSAPVDKSLLKLFPQKLAEKLVVFPILFQQQKSVLTVLMVQPDDLDIIQQIQFATRVHEVKALVAREAAIQAAILRHYKGQGNAFASIQMELSTQQAQQNQEQLMQATDDALQRKSALSIPPVMAQDDTMGMVLERPKSVSAKAAVPSNKPKKPPPPIPAPPQHSVPAGRPSYLPEISLPGAVSISGAEQPRQVSEIPASGVSYKGYIETLKVMIALLENDRGDLRGHTLMVGKLCQRVCQRMGLSEDESNEIAIAAYLHDIGKASAYHLTSLNVAEYKGHRIQAKKVYSTPVRIFESVELSQAIKEILLHMYERYDGKGIPDRQSGKDIPLGSRIIAITDTYADLTGQVRNPYRKKLSPQEACDILFKFKNKVFDPNVLDIFKLEMLGDDMRAKTRLSGKKALLIDPDPEETTVLELKLIENGFGVTVARNSVGIEKILKSDEYNVIISEVELTPLDGFSLLQKLRDEAGLQIPFIFLARKSSSDMVKRGFELGAIDFLTKPVSADLIALKIGQVMDAVPRKKTSRGVSGSLEEMALPDVVQILFHGRKSGKLSIVSGTQSGEIYFSDGHICDATFGDKQHEEAFYQMLTLKSGHFELDPDFRSTNRMIEMTPESLLLEGMRRMDEGH